ncbi:zf-HC2 domain-containing protein [Brevibacillus humidisoli]|uniref:anti-sigma factor family protein n=1 Tax=Brevibacillus humidisoli TaxID=2895522 RepID=UPI001E63630D|nr:zf-HC2 domain-containing protein [Brevibacillus humidisoli]UFJ39965.1 zf-HC2 domain-containing protein [Brevibacillus humidisoli]
MSHIDEITMMMYTDGELLTEESEKVAEHLRSCQECRNTYDSWMEDRSFFEQSFSATSAPLPSLHPSVTQQIDAICALHRKNRQASSKIINRLTALLLSLFLLAVIPAQSWLFNWLEWLWPIVQPYLLWTSTFWLRENAHTLWDYLLLSCFLFSALFVCLILAIILTGANRQAESIDPAYSRGGDRP